MRRWRAAVKIFVVSPGWAAVNYRFAIEAHTARVTAVAVLPAPPPPPAAAPAAAAALTAPGYSGGAVAHGGLSMAEAEAEAEPLGGLTTASAAAASAGGGGGGDPLGVTPAAEAEPVVPLLFRTRGEAAAKQAAQRNAHAYGSAPAPPPPPHGSAPGAAYGGEGGAAAAGFVHVPGEWGVGVGAVAPSGGGGGGGVGTRRVQVLASCSAENGPHALCLYDTDSMAALNSGGLLLPKHDSLFAAGASTFSAPTGERDPRDPNGLPEDLWLPPLQCICHEVAHDRLFIGSNAYADRVLEQPQGLAGAQLGLHSHVRAPSRDRRSILILPLSSAEIQCKHVLHDAHSASICSLAIDEAPPLPPPYPKPTTCPSAALATLFLLFLLLSSSPF